MRKNTNLNNAKRKKNDEFYTLYEDIEKELKHYKKHFKNKIVYCNCDDPKKSNFWKYFYDNFNTLELKKLIATYYDPEHAVYKYEYDGINIYKTVLNSTGDFRSEECIEILKEADIVVTNPPFSLFREYIKQLIEYNKKFIIWGNSNAIGCKDIFPLLKNNKVWLGNIRNKTCIFRLSNEYEKYDKKLTEEKNDGNKYGKVPAVSVFTNLDLDKIHESLVLTRNYYGNEDTYPKYDNYDAININKVSDIPCDYVPCWFNCPYIDNCLFAKSKGEIDFGLCDLKNAGEMGVPITFFDKYNPEQFEIIDSSLNLGKPMSEIDPTGIYEKGGPAFYLKEQTNSNGNIYRRLYTRIVIRRKCNGTMGVPITFIDKHNPEQFEIIGELNHGCDNIYDLGEPIINGKRCYSRLLIRQKS